MAASNVCWGIEVGAFAIKAIKLEAEGDGVRVVDFAVIRHPRVLSAPELDLNDALRVALGALTARVDLSKAQLAISLPGHQGFARFAKLPPVEPKKVPDVVKFEAGQQIPFDLSEVEWDYQTFVSPDSPVVEVGIFAITKAKVNERLGLLGDMGITPDQATLSPLAAYNALAFDLGFTGDTKGTVLLDIGTTASDLIIADAGRVWIRTFPIGGHNFTDALVNAFKLSYLKAEKLKLEGDQGKNARHVFQAMRPVFTDLAQEVQRSIGYYQSLHPEAQLTRLIGLGSTFRLPGLRKYIKQQLQVDVYRVEQFKRANVDGPQAGEFQEAALNLATAYGLALQGLGLAALRANLMPTQVIRTAVWKRKTPWFATAAGLGVAAGGAMYLRWFLDSSVEANLRPPAEFSRVAEIGQSAATQAREMGVTGEGEATNLVSAGSMGALLAHKGLFAHLTADLQRMVADTTTQVRPQLPERAAVAMSIQRVEVDYRPGAGAMAAAAGDPSGLSVDPNQGTFGAPMLGPGSFDEGMAGRGMIEQGFGAGPVGGGAGASGGASGTREDIKEAEIKDEDRFLVRVTITTPHPDPNAFAIEAVERWLNDREAEGKLADKPYRWVLSDTPREELPLPPSAAGQTGGQTGGPAGGLAGDFGQRPGFEGEAGRGGRGLETLQPADPNGRLLLPPGDLRGGGGLGGGLPAAGPVNLVPTADELPPPATGRMVLTFFLVLDRPQPAAEGGVGADVGGGA